MPTFAYVTATCNETQHTPSVVLCYQNEGRPYAYQQAARNRSLLNTPFIKYSEIPIQLYNKDKFLAHVETTLIPSAKDHHPHPVVKNTPYAEPEPTQQSIRPDPV
jgi:hypothetical protein